MDPLASQVTPKVSAACVHQRQHPKPQHQHGFVFTQKHSPDRFWWEHTHPRSHPNMHISQSVEQVGYCRLEFVMGNPRPRRWPFFKARRPFSFFSCSATGVGFLMFLVGSPPPPPVHPSPLPQSKIAVPFQVGMATTKLKVCCKTRGEDRWAKLLLIQKPQASALQCSA